MEYGIWFVVVFAYIVYKAVTGNKLSEFKEETINKLFFLKKITDSHKADLELLKSKTQALEEENSRLKELIEQGSFAYSTTYTAPDLPTPEIVAEPITVEPIMAETIIPVPEPLETTQYEFSNPEVVPAAPVYLEPVEVPIAEPVSELITIQNPVTEPEVVLVPGRPKTNFPPPIEEKQATEPAGFDFEELLGGNLLGKVGIGVLVLGIGFFVKYAVDEGWLNEAARTFLGCLAGFIMIALGQFKFKDYRLYSSLLIGGGFAATFLSLGLGYQEYKVLSKEVTAGLLAATSIMVYALAAYNNRIEISIVAFLGAFALPFIASDGTGSVVVLFSYYLILNIGTIALALKKDWSILLNLSAFFVWGMFTVVLSTQATTVEVDRYALVLFSILYFFIYFSTSVYLTAKNGFSLNVIYVLVSNTLLSLLITETLLQPAEPAIYFKIMPAIMGALIMGVAWYYRWKEHYKDLATVLFTMAAGCFVITAPLAFEAGNIAIVWFTLGMVMAALTPILNLPYQKYVALALIIVGSLPSIFFLLTIPTQNQLLPEVDQASFIRAGYIIVLFWLYRIKTKLFYVEPEEIKFFKSISLYVAAVATFILGWALTITYSILNPIDFWIYEYAYLLIGITAVIIVLHLFQSNIELTVNTIKLYLLPIIAIVIICQINDNGISTLPYLEPEFLLGLTTVGFLLGIQTLIKIKAEKYQPVLDEIGITNNHFIYLSIFVFWATLQSELFKVSYYIWEVPNFQFMFFVVFTTAITALVYTYYALTNKSTIAGWLSLLFSGIALSFYLYTQGSTYVGFGDISLLKLGFNPWNTTEYLLVGLSLILLSTIGYFSKSVILIIGSSDTDMAKSVFRIIASIVGAAVILLLIKNLEGNILLPNIKLFHSVNDITNAVVPVLIGVLLIIYGFKTQISLWRKIGLVFIAIIVVKLHLIDVWGYSGIMKIVTFISLGVMMLAASFLFQKIKKVIE